MTTNIKIFHDLKRKDHFHEKSGLFLCEKQEKIKKVS